MSVDTAKHRVTAIPGSPFPVAGGKDVTTVAFDPAAGFLAATTEATNGTHSGKLYMFSIASVAGALAPVSGSPLALNGTSGAASLTFSPDGRLLVASDAGGGLSWLAVDSSTGSLTELSGSTFAAPAPGSSAMLPPGSSGSAPFAVQAGGGEAVELDPVAGKLSTFPGAPYFPIGGWPNIAVSPDARLLAAPGGIAGVQLAALSPASLTTPESVATGTGMSAVWVAFSPDSRLLASGDASGGVSLFQVGSGRPPRRRCVVPDLSGDTLAARAQAAGRGALPGR